jgi:hypothetical protein
LPDFHQGQVVWLKDFGFVQLFKTQLKEQQRFYIVHQDQPSAYFVWIRPDGTTTKLSHYTGCISPANIELNKLIDKLPKLIGIEDLVR